MTDEKSEDSTVMVADHATNEVRGYSHAEIEEAMSLVNRLARYGYSDAMQQSYYDLQEFVTAARSIVGVPDDEADN